MPATRVLCVEDDSDTRLMLELLLGQSDFEAVAAPDADAALRLMGGERFGLYVLDGGRWGDPGPSLCERIRAADARSPIIIFSADASPPASGRDYWPGLTPTSSSPTLKHSSRPSGGCWKRPTVQSSEKERASPRRDPPRYS